MKHYFIIIKLFFKGFKISEIQKIIEEYRFKKMMLEFRSYALVFGFDINNYSDDEIIEMTNTAGKEIGKCGINSDEAYTALIQLQKRMVELQPRFN